MWDKAERKGAVYLPLPRVDGKRFEINTHSIYRGIEGSWFRTSDKWNHFALKTLALAKSPYVVEKPVQ